jgi:hypothetical protein
MRGVHNIYESAHSYIMAEKVRNWAPLYSSRENVEVELFMLECVIGRAAHLMTYFLLREWRASFFCMPQPSIIFSGVSLPLA